MSLTEKTCRDRVWITPERVLAPVRAYFGGSIDLDPATEPNNPTGARRFFTEADDGLTRLWQGDVFLNPPYGRELEHWASKIYFQAAVGTHLIALLPPTRTETAYWQQHIFNRHLSAVCFIRKRLAFLRPDGSKAGANVYSSALYLYNGKVQKFANHFSDLGKCFHMVEIKGVTQ